MTAAHRLLMHGAHGRMGMRITELARNDARFTLVGAVDRETGDPPPASIDVIIDFSSPAGTLAAAELASARRAALVVGTTGLERAQFDRLDRLATEVAVLVAPNTSLGVAVLRFLTTQATKLLAGWDIDIVESHHNRKKDAPSGTALALAAAVRAGGRELAADRIHALRGGDIVGEHEVHFAGPGETIRLEHVAVSRDLFALGALRAAAWLAGKPAGRYTMEHALGLSGS